MKKILTLLLTTFFAAAAPVPRDTIKSYFNFLDYPTEAQFADLADSFSNDLTDGWKLDGPGIGSAITVDRSIAFLPANTLLAINPYSSTCEIRKISSVVGGTTVNLNASLVHTHSDDSPVIIIRGGFADLKLWGAIGNSSTNDTVAIQAALDDQSRAGLSFWLEGNSAIYGVTSPIVGPSGCRMQNMTWKAIAGSYAPVEATNAVFVNSVGTILTFTGSASTDYITTASAHGLPTASGAPGARVMLKNVTGLGGVVAGRAYYTVHTESTPTAFKLALTQNGAAVDITSDGSGTCYAEVIAASRFYMRDVTFDGGSIAGNNGMYVYTQQPMDAWKLRVDNCPAIGIKLVGQDGAFNNVLVGGCGIALDMHTASMMKIISFNAERCATGIRMELSNINTFLGLHFELNSGGGLSNDTSACIEVISGSHNTFDGIQASLTTATQAVLRNTGTTSVGYTLRNVSVTGSNDPRMVDDAARGLSLGAVAEYQRHLTHLDAPGLPTAAAFYDYGTTSYWGVAGKFLKFGAGNKTVPVLSLRPDNDVLAGLLIDAKTATGGVAMTLSKAGDMVAGIRGNNAAAPTLSSAATITPTTPVAFVSGTTTINTITAPAVFSATGGTITLIPTGVFSTGTSGNIAIASTSVVGKALVMTYDSATVKWYPSY